MHLCVVACAAAVASAPAGVVSYPVEFFAKAAPATAFDMVQRLPGFSMERGNQTRGLSSASGNVLVDGKPPISKNDSLDEVLKRIPVSAVARIEIIRGGASGVDMRGRAVLANVVRRPDAGFRGSITASDTVLFDARHMAGVRLEGQWRANQRLLELSAIAGQAGDDWLGPGERARTGPDGATQILSSISSKGVYTREQLNAAFEDDLAGGRLKLTGVLVNNPFESRLTDHALVPDGIEIELNDNDRRQADLGIDFTHQLGGGLEWEVVGYQQWARSDTRASFQSALLDRRFSLRRRTSESVANAQLRAERWKSLSLEAGLEAARNDLRSETDLLVNGQALAVPAADVQVREERLDGFVTATWTPTPELSADGTFRQEISTITSRGDVELSKSLTFFKPRIAATWSPNAQNQFRLRLEREVSQLSFDDFVASSTVANTGAVLAGNPDLMPQQAEVIEVVAERRFADRGAIILTARALELEDVLDRIAVIGPTGVVADAPGNIGDGWRRELSATLSLPLGRLGLPGATLRGQATRRWSQVKDPITGADRPISGLRPLEWDFHFSQDAPGWRLTWGVDVTGPFRERYFRVGEIETRKFDAWVTLFLERKLGSDYALRLEAQNLGERSFTRIREVYDGARDLAPPLYADVRDLSYGRAFYVRLRKTFS